MPALLMQSSRGTSRLPNCGARWPCRPMTHGALPLAAWGVSLVQKSLNGAVSNLILMFGYLAVTMSATCSQAFFSTSEPDHMNQFRVTFPSLDPEEPELPPPQPATSAVARAIETIEVRRDTRMPLLPEGSVICPADRIRRWGS